MVYIKSRLQSAIKRTSFITKLIIPEKTKPIYFPSLDRKDSNHFTSYCIYQVTCNCGSSYIGRTDSMLKNRLEKKQINSTDPINAAGRYPASSIAKHLHKIIYTNKRGESFSSPSHQPSGCSTPP